jgi:hypothetical protein
VVQADAVHPSRGFLDRDPDSYSRVEWLARTGIRNVQWVQDQGIRRLLEEHELHPARRTVAAVRRARWRRSHPVGRGEAMAVFVTGVPRSGTNMVVRGLAISPEFDVHNEGDRSAFHRYRLRPDPVIHDLVMSSRHRYVLFKPLLDCHRIGVLLDQVGPARTAKALWAYRDVDGRVRSALAKFGPAAMNALRDIAEGNGAYLWQSQGLSEQSLDLIRSVDWDRAEPADGAALLWFVKNRMFFELGLEGRPDVLPVSYNVFVREPEATMRVLCRFLDITWDPRYCSHVDARATRRRDPVLLDPRIRERCDTLTGQLDAAAVVMGRASRVQP